MPPLPAAPLCAKISFQGVADGEPIANIFHVQYSGSGDLTQADVDDLASFAATTFDADLVPQLCETYHRTQTIVTDLNDSSGAVSTFFSSTAGTEPTPSAPQSACVVIQHLISRRYRGGHPRTYFGPFGTNGLNSGRSWSSVTTANVLSHYITFETAMNTHALPSGRTIVLGCVSYRAGNAVRATPLFEPFTGASVDNRVCSQRRRLGKDRLFTG